MKLKKHFKEALADLDFSRIEKTMIALDWKWYTHEGYMRPSIEQMKRSVKERYKQAKKLYKDSGEISYVSSGGFHVSVDEGCVSILFAVSHSESIDRDL